MPTSAASPGLHVTVRGEEDRALQGDEAYGRERRRHRRALAEGRQSRSSGTDDDPAADAEQRREEPAASPMTTRRTGLFYERGCRQPARAAWRSSRERAAVLLDVDGTLAPIVDRPEEARVPPATREILAGLVGRYRLVACISGRPGREAERVVGVEGVRYVGEHGLELRAGSGSVGRTARELRAGHPLAARGRQAAVALVPLPAGADPEVAREELELVAERAVAEGLRPAGAAWCSRSGRPWTPTRARPSASCSPSPAPTGPSTRVTIRPISTRSRRSTASSSGVRVAVRLGRKRRWSSASRQISASTARRRWPRCSRRL